MTKLFHPFYQQSLICKRKHAACEQAQSCPPSLWFRKSERGYFARRKVSGDGNIVVYYLISSIVQAVILIGGILAALLIVPSKSDYYIPREAVFSKSITFIIVAALVSIVVTVENMMLAQKTKK